jgi:uroporphyrinogen decarboxylase
MEGGRFALGSGNSVTNFVPVENYLIMLDEAAGWK